MPGLPGPANSLRLLFSCPIPPGRGYLGIYKVLWKKDTDSEKRNLLWIFVLTERQWLIIRGNRHDQNQGVFCRSENDYFVLTISQTPINPNAEGAVSIHHAFYVEPDEFDRAVQYLKDNGVTIAKEETRGAEAAFGGRHCYFYDPDGNVLELLDPVCGIAESKAGFYARTPA
jgi:catechol 2,3-dioxygenase-like lactoylglutathione lyase family enzyme